jgi:release factor glutamine methyltransferase
LSLGNDVRAVVAAAETRLGAAGIEAARVDAELLLARVLTTTRSGIRADGRRELTAEELAEVEELLVRREAREPLAYVLGEWGFRRLTLKVDRRALVPRPETEIVVERCLALLRGIEGPRVLDVGTGSGAIALALADEHPGARVTGIDASPEAVALARENAARLGMKSSQVTTCNLASSVELLEHDLFDGLPDGPWDLVVSNPPYVRPEDIGRLASEVRDWEPRAALVGEGATEAIAAHARSVLDVKGALVLEVADGDAGRVAGLLRGDGYSDVVVTHDLTGRQRVVEGRLG